MRIGGRAARPPGRPPAQAGVEAGEDASHRGLGSRREPRNVRGRFDQAARTLGDQVASGEVR
jgi:hypothetical protein